MNCLSLKCRRLGNPDAVCGLRNLIRREAPALVFLSETKLSSSEMRKVTASLEGYCSMEVDSVGRSGGLAFLRRDDVRVSFRSASVHYMDFDIGEEGVMWRLTGFYGSPMVQDRYLSWQLLKNLAEENYSSWLCIGDFNEILYANEMKDGSRAQWQMNNFREAAMFVGCGEGVRREFRFEQIWVGEAGCEDTIRRVWEDGDYDVLETISRCADELKKWKGASTSKILRDLNRKRKRLSWLNENERFIVNVKERRRLMGEITHLLRQEEMFWRQRSRTLWLKDRDRNTKYFHRKARQRKNKNNIKHIMDSQGTTCEGVEAVKTTAVGFFSLIFASSRPEQFDELLDGVRGRVTDSMNGQFRAEYRGEEVFEALNQMHPLKASGPDGMNALFYQTY
ncbi:uncharacterized protein LOC141595187 [Silene latifolia]|uniref:uncharacterized protein LOC141595187 n=1 Tax=Silene latifolia TaxID=37657 RepID=UPI003D776E5D